MSRSRAWCFTLNNPTEHNEHELFDFAWNCSYFVGGREIAPTTGTPHIQGFFYLGLQTTRSALLKRLPEGIHLEPKGSGSTFKQCSDYCKKGQQSHEEWKEQGSGGPNFGVGADFFEHGTLPWDQEKKGEAGKQSIEERWELAKNGDFESLPPEHIRTYQYIYTRFQEVEDRNGLHNYWVWGATGVGKSRWVREHYGEGMVGHSEQPVHPGFVSTGFYSKGTNKWWDGYNNENVVLIDDFDPDHGKYLAYYLKIWADHYAFNAEVKGGMLKIRPLIVIITSQYPLEACFERKEDVDALSRRFEIINLVA